MSGGTNVRSLRAVQMGTWKRTRVAATPARRCQRRRPDHGPTQSDRPTDEREHQYITCPAGGQDRTGRDSRATGAGLPGSQQLTDELDRPIRTVVTNVCPGGY